MLHKVEQFWYTPSKWKWLLWPLCLPFLFIVMLRRFYHQKIKPSKATAVPVVVVGNITVGGTGKTPYVCALVKALQQQGLTPGVISRGYGRQLQKQIAVSKNSTAAEVGDEPLEIAKQCHCAVVVGTKRYDCAQQLLELHPEVNIIVSDDGLQHYALPRALEIVLVDSKRRFGNGLLLPFGPLRELPIRLRQADHVVYTGQHVQCDGMAVNLKTGENKPLSEIGKCHAVAAIANPMKFYQLLNRYNMHYITHKFRDHHDFRAQDVQFNDNLPIVMTQKDAVKCQVFAHDNMWMVPITVLIEPALVNAILQLIPLLPLRGSDEEDSDTNLASFPRRRESR